MPKLKIYRDSSNLKKHIPCYETQIVLFKSIYDDINGAARDNNRSSWGSLYRNFSEHWAI